MVCSFWRKNCTGMAIHVLHAERPWNESLSAKIAKVQEAFKNIPPMLFFSPSSVIYDGVGVCAAEHLPKGNEYASLYYMLHSKQ